MAKVILRQEAIDDLTDIWDYTFQEWSEDQADIYYHTIKLACKGIEANFNIGKIYTEISKGLFGLKSGKHIIFYHQISEDEIEVIRILHERMDLKNRINE
ncbi:type II toxin-antitoxin system RelE/ParE family toxin [Epilithonimonas tenax]|uniref:type II toxin-antitoxin system RelE/ParE family toxin n=1 Tax=Epilithonimonas tenax TaxID=191577 RepID=UPI0004840550|nr:type II toxin-antitoxin system RelE/ParE family toxin [Epilithonimonas tenax]